MKPYRLKLTKQVLLETEICVTAHDADDAEEQALDAADDTEWTEVGDTYPSVESCEEEST